MGSPSELSVSCLCGAASQTVRVLGDTGPATAGNPGWTLCHCTTCRHITGLLFASYCPIQRPGSTAGLEEIDVTPHSNRYFCRTCGCHVFRRSTDNDTWEVATGAIVASPSVAADTTESKPPLHMDHAHTEDTKDGGASVWFSTSSPQPSGPQGSLSRGGPTAASKADTLRASCHCGHVRFHITRPNEQSTAPRSNLPDLMTAYCATDPAVTSNPNDIKWWLRQNATKYLAGTCACRSCRLVSGFEIQTWAFVPRSNISFDVSAKGAEPGQTIPLDFETLPADILQSYESSPGVLREFCPQCGATVFWHDKWRPDVMDVSVGLLAAEEGARAESWLDWWTDRVSFAEDARTERTGFAADRAEHLVAALAQGLHKWAGESPAASI